MNLKLSKELSIKLSNIIKFKKPQKSEYMILNLG